MAGGSGERAAMDSIKYNRSQLHTAYKEKRKSRFLKYRIKVKKKKLTEEEHTKMISRVALRMKKQRKSIFIKSIIAVIVSFCLIYLAYRFFINQEFNFILKNF